MREDLLFYRTSLNDVLFSYPKLLAKEIDTTDRNTILNASLSDLTDHFVSKFTCDIPRLLLEQAYQLDPQDVDIDVSHDFTRHFREPGPHYLKGTAYTLVIPCEGDADFFGFQPSTYSLSGIRGEVKGSTLVLRHQQLDDDGAAVKRDFDERIAQVQGYLETQRRDAQVGTLGCQRRSAASLKPGKERASKP